MPFVGVDSRVGAARSATVAAAPLQITPLFPESFPNLAVVGTVLFAINHLDEVVNGKVTRVLWIKIAVTYLVPFTVSNLGLLVGSRVKK